jgi:hypothetical protein
MIERLVVEAPAGLALTVSDLTIAGTPIRFGGQVAECITVKLIGIANIVPTPVVNPRIGIRSRGYLDPFYPRTVSLTDPSGPLPPGTIEAFLHEGAAPRGTATKQRETRSRRDVAAMPKTQRRLMNRTR